MHTSQRTETITSLHMPLVRKKREKVDTCLIAYFLPIDLLFIYFHQLLTQQNSDDHSNIGDQQVEGAIEDNGNEGDTEDNGNDVGTCRKVKTRYERSKL